jgi:hypothetical protein
MKTERWQKLVCVAYFFISPLLPFGVYYLNRNIDSFVDGFPNFLPIITTFVFFLIGGRLLFIAWKISNKANLITLFSDNWNGVFWYRIGLWISINFRWGLIAMNWN